MHKLSNNTYGPIDYVCMHYDRITIFKILCIIAGMLPLAQVTAQQDTIRLRKPSFEQKPQAGTSGRTAIRGWFDCGIIHFPAESPPDIHPVNFWGNTKQANDGDTYLGLVVRDNDTYESVSQKLPSKMLAGQCYTFSVYLSRSERYLSASKMDGSDKKYNYTNPTVMRIWGGFGHCDLRELLGETVPVAHSEWKRYDFKLKPKQDISSITIEAFYKVPVVLPYNGHILVDNLSPLVRVDCEAPVEVAEETVKKRPPHKRRRKKQPVEKIVEQPQPEPEESVAVSPQPKILLDLDRDKIREGQKIEISNLYFEADKSEITPESYDVLDEVYSFLKEYIDVTVEIGGHTNNQPSHKFCDRLSTDRAKAVAEFLVKKGIPASRLTYKGYGKRKPIANNLTKEGREKNQRVEIKILKIG